MANHQAKRHTNTALRQRAREMLMEGKTPDEIATEIGVHMTTVWRWRRDPVFAAKLAAAQEARLAIVGDKVKSYASEAIDFLRTAMRNEEAPMPSRVKSAELILDRAGMTSKAPPSSTVIVSREPKYTAEELEAAKRWILENESGGTDGGG